METLKKLTLKEVEDLCLNMRNAGIESDFTFLDVFVPDKE